VNFFRKVAGDVLPYRRIRGAIRFWLRFGAVSRDRSFKRRGTTRHRRFSRRSPTNFLRKVHRQARPNSSHEVCFPSALAGHAALPRRRHAARPSRFDVRSSLRFFALRCQIRLTRSNPRGLAARLSDAPDSHTAAHRTSCIAAFLVWRCSAMRDAAFVTWSPSNRQSATPALDCLAGQTLHLLQADVSTRPARTSRSSGSEVEASAHHQGAVRSRRFARRRSWDFHPSQVCSR